MGLLGTLARYLLIALAVWALYKLLRRWMAGRAGAEEKMDGRPGRAAGEIADVMVQDPQCGTYLPKHEALRVRAEGRERYFCSEACRDAFLARSQAAKAENKTSGE